MPVNDSFSHSHSTPPHNTPPSQSDPTTNDTATPQHNRPIPFHVYAKNCRVNTNGKITTLLGELDTLHWDILLISEARAKTAVSELAGGHQLYTCLQNAAGSGTAILLHAKHSLKVRKHHFISDRVIAVDAQLGHRTTRFIAAYAPHAGYSNDDLQSFYDSLCYLASDARA